MLGLQVCITASGLEFMYCGIDEEVPLNKSWILFIKGIN
jgi:hypothetical protein